MSKDSMEQETLGVLADLAAVLSQPVDEQIRFLVAAQAPLTVALGEILGALDAHTKMLAQLCAAHGIDPRGNDNY